MIARLRLLAACLPLLAGFPAGCSRPPNPPPPAPPAGRDVAAFHQAAETGDTNALDALHALGIPETATGATGLSALHAAAMAGNADAVRWLLARGAPPETMDFERRTPLELAVRHNRAAAIAALAAAGANPSAPASTGQPLLVLAVLLDRPAAVGALLGAGADPRTRLVSPAGQEALDLCEGTDFHDDLRHDANIPVLCAASALNRLDCARLLVEAGAQRTDVSRRYRMNALSHAASRGNVPMMRLLLGKDPTPAEPAIRISLRRQTATYYKDGAAARTTRISTGRAGYRTPKGEYVITDKHRSWVSTLYHVSMPYFMRLSSGAIGLHAGVVPRYPASHGCIRLPYGEARAFFGLAEVGDVVVIAD